MTPEERKQAGIRGIAKAMLTLDSDEMRAILSIPPQTQESEPDLEQRQADRIEHLEQTLCGVLFLTSKPEKVNWPMVCEQIREALAR